jgi:hypothetical protein
MALAVTINFGVLDEKGAKSSTKIRVPNGFSIPQYIEFAQGAAQVLAGISTGQITSASICIGLDISTATIKASVLTGADRFQKAFFQWATAVAGFFARIRLPAFNELYIAAGTDAVDLTAAPIMALDSMMTDGIVVTGGTILPTNEREMDVVTLTTAKQQFRKK